MTAPRILPPALAAHLQAFGADAARALADALCHSDADIAVRANVIKGVSAAGTDRVPWLDSAVYLPSRPVFALDPHWHQGLYYVQDASSMAMTPVVKYLTDNCLPGSPLRILDACAAPGGKSISIIDAMPEGSLLLANEYEPARARVLCENIAKYGSADVVVSQGDTDVIADRLAECFDMVVVDAPCSGEGMIRKEPEALAQWSEALVDDMSRLQRHIIDNCMRALRPGGVLVYSTCTFNRHEDEDNVRYISREHDAELITLPLAAFPGAVGSISADVPGMHFLPGSVRGEGLFIAAVRKAGLWTPAVQTSPKHRQTKAKQPPEALPFMHRHMRCADAFTAFADAGGAVAVRKEHADFASLLSARLHMLRPGLPLYAVKGKDMQPSWELAVSAIADTGTFPHLHLDREQSLYYLHGDSIADMAADMPRGYVMAMYDGRPLGFVKNIGRRANNLYPDPYRLRLDPSRPSAAAGTASLPQIISI